MRVDGVWLEGGDIISMVLIKMGWARIIYPVQSSRDQRHYLLK